MKQLQWDLQGGSEMRSRFFWVPGTLDPPVGPWIWWIGRWVPWIPWITSGYRLDSLLGPWTPNPSLDFGSLDHPGPPFGP